MYIVMITIAAMIVMSIWQFISFTLKQEKHHMHRIGMSFELFYTLLIIYGIVIIGFGLIYFILGYYNEILIEIGQVPDFSVLDELYRSFYFSGVTMLTIGYGDIIPVGIGRLLAVIQAMIGYILPTTFVLKLVHINLEASEKF